MKTIIIYASKTGTTEKCAKKVANKIENATMIDLNNQGADITDKDLIIIGTPIRMGLINKKVKRFISLNKEILKVKKVAYFICCGFSENYKQYFEQNIPKELLDKAIVYETFGGEMDIEKQKGFDKFITKMVSKNIDENIKIKILDQNIDKFIKAIK